MKVKSIIPALLLAVAGLQTACSNNAASNNDDNENDNDLIVVVEDDGTTSNGSKFSAIDDTNFYIDNVKYTAKNGHLVVTGYNEDKLQGEVKIISKLTYEGKTYEVLGIGEEAFFAERIIDLMTGKEIGNGLTSIIIPNSVVSIGNDAFTNCFDLTSITIPESVTNIGEGAFSGCIGLTSITIPESVTRIRDYTFSGCYNLTSITIPNSMTSIGSWAFYNCASLTSITIPKGVTNIGEGAFDGCDFGKDSFVNRSALTDDNYWGATICDEEVGDGLLITNNVVVKYRGTSNSVTIPDYVTSIGKSAFWGRSSSSLTSIIIPNSVTSIGEGAFFFCSGLTSVTIPNSVTSIGECAFENCNSLTSVTMMRETPISILDSDTFENRKNATLYVPIGSKAAYEAAEYWNEFKEIVEMEMEE